MTKIVTEDVTDLTIGELSNMHKNMNFLVPNSFEVICDGDAHTVTAYIRLEEVTNE